MHFLHLWTWIYDVFFFSLLMWWFILIIFWMLNQACLPRINLTWSCMYKSFFIVVRFDCLYFVFYKEENSICHIKVQTPYIQKANISFKTAWKLISLCPNVLYWADWHLFMDVIFLDADFNLHFLKVYLEVDFSI